MANWYDGWRWNGGALHRGFFWNGATFKLFLNVYETVKMSDKVTELLAELAIKEDKIKLIEAIVTAAVLKETDSFPLQDDYELETLYQVTDKFKMTDAMTELLVYAALTDNFELIDSAKMLSASIKTDDEFKFIDDVSLEAFVKALDDFGIKDALTHFSTLLQAYDTFILTDGEPRTAISDFILGVADDVDNAYDWFLPFGLKIDWNTSSIQVMPEAELTKIEMPGIDGSIVEDTVYKDRLFQIVGYSEDGLTRQQKEELKSKIAQILDATKNEPKRMYVQAKDHTFDVKYEGQAVITDGPSFVKATIPLRTPPYGYEIFQNDLIGSGLILNSGDAPLGVQNNIKGPVSNPSFRMNETIYTYNGEVPEGKTLVIDHDLMTCYLVDGFGRKENVLANLTGEFQRIPKHSAVTLSVIGSYSRQIMTSWRNKILW